MLVRDVPRCIEKIIVEHEAVAFGRSRGVLGVMIAGMDSSAESDRFGAVCRRLEEEARKEAKKAAKWEREDRWVAIFLLVGAAAFSAAGSATVFADRPTTGAILAGAGSLAAAINAAVRPAERQGRQLRQQADLLRVADKLQLLRCERAEHLEADARDTELASLIDDLAEIRGRGFVGS